jgi:hypothetical protein
MCLLIALMLSLDNCVSPDPRPLYADLWATYGANPDCLNRDRHIRYLKSLQSLPMKSGDTVNSVEYNNAIDLYIERMQWYCETK